MNKRKGIFQKSNWVICHFLQNSGSDSYCVSQEQEFTGVLKVALAAIDSDTESFETALQENKKDVSHLLGVFRRVSLKSIY